VTQYLVALYDESDPNCLDRVLYEVTKLPEIGSIIAVTSTFSPMYDGTLHSHLIHRKVRLVGRMVNPAISRLYEEDKHQVADSHNFLVEIADPRERAALEKLRHIYSELGGTTDGVSVLIDGVLLPQEDGRAKISMLIEALNDAGFTPAHVAAWYSEFYDTIPEWLQPYLSPSQQVDY
jgi:hypothetical protein